MLFFASVGILHDNPRTTIASSEWKVADHQLSFSLPPNDLIEWEIMFQRSRFF